MKTWITVIHTETIKLRRSNVLWGTLVFFLFITVLRVGAIDRTTYLQAGWATYLQDVVFMYATVFGLIGFATIASWTFGREYTDRTLKDLLALPVSRAKIVGAKFVSTIIVCLIMAVFTYEFAVLMGGIVGIPGFTLDVAGHYFIQMLILSGMHLLLCGPVILLASISRGYLMPIGFAFTMLMIALIVGPTGLGAYLPWSIPALQLKGSLSAVLPLGLISYLIPAFVGCAGLLGTWAWWRWADHK